MTAQRLFISHASEDEAVVSRIVAYLEANGAPCWISSRDIPARAIYADAIAEAMQACSACVVVVSPASNASKAVKRELELASHEDKPFIPVRIDGTEPTAGTAYYLRNTQWIDYGRQGERALDRIVQNLRGGAPSPPTDNRENSSSSPKLRMALIAAAIFAAAIGGAGWLWTRNAATTAVATDASEILGAYFWDGIPCGDGPSIAQAGDELVFTMPNTPTFRHQIVSVEGAEGAYSARVQTRVIAPADQAGREYTLSRLRDTGDLLVDTASGRNVWSSCPQP